MTIKHNLNLDLARRGCDPIIHVTQGDANAHLLHIRITNNRQPWKPPEGLTALVHYSNSFGSGGSYDTLADGRPAATPCSDGILLELVPEMAALPGSVHVAVTLLYGSRTLSAFHIWLMVEGLADAAAPVLSNYSRISGFLTAPETAAEGQYLQVGAVDSQGHVTLVSAADLPGGAVGTAGIELEEQEAGVLIRIRNGDAVTDSAMILHGQQGQEGPEGAPGRNGSDGVGITSVRQTAVSAEDGGSNVLTVTLSDGTGATFTVRNGSRGSTGASGRDGYTPVKGVDYFDGKDANAPEAYVLAEARRLAAVVQAHQNPDTFSFLAVSDFHHTLSENSPSVDLQQLQQSLLHCGQGLALTRKQLHIDFAAMLGDLVWDSGETPAEAMAAMAEVNAAVHEGFLALPNFRAVGNHDRLTQGTAVLTDAQIFAALGIFHSGSVCPQADRIQGFCYRDFSPWKVRVIVLNTSETDGEVQLSQSQRQWLEEALQVDTGENWGSIILSHIPLDRWGNDSETMQVIKGASGILCCIHGHTHNYKVDNLADTAIKRIAVPNACFYRTNEVGENGVSETPDGVEWGDGTTYAKTAGTAQDTAFCVITVDRKAGRLYADHYGAGCDRVVEIPALPAALTNLVPSSLDLDGEGIWNGTGYRDATYLTTSAPYYSSCTQGAVMIGLLPYSAESEYLPTVYLKGVDFSTAYSHNRIGFFDSSFVCKETYKTSDAAFASFFTLTELADRYYSLEPKYTDGYNPWQYTGKTWFRYLSISAVGSGADLTVTFDQPIT